MPVQAPAQAGVFRDRYPIFDRAIYLNSCSLGALSQRAREIGLRIALGADPGRVWRGIVAQGLPLATAGSLAGAIGIR